MENEQSIDDFKAIYERRQKEKEDKSKKKTFTDYGKDRETPEWLGLEDMKEKAFRIVGKSAEFRASPFDCKIIFHSEILSDDGKSYVKINWPQKTKTLENGFVRETGEVDDQWILYRLYNDIMMNRRWEKFGEGIVKDGKTGQWVYNYAETDVYKRIDSNRKVGDKYPPGFKYSRRVVVNIIDRHDSYCSDNNHTKLLSSKHTFWKMSEKEKLPIYFTDVGIPGQLYDQLIENTARFRKGWYDEDFVVMKDKKNKKYEVNDASDSKRVSEEIRKIASVEKLSEKEQNYEKYDLDKLFPYTSYNKLLKKVPNLFKAADVLLGTNYYDILEHLASEEKEAWEKNKSPSKTSVQTKAPEVEKASESFVKRESVEQKEEFRVVDSNGKSLEQQCETNFKSWSSLSQKDKDTIMSEIDHFDEKGVPKFKKGITTIPCSDESCHFADGTTTTSFSSNVGQCAVCGVKYET